MHQQQNAFALHGFEHGVDFAQVGDARVAVGGGACRIQLAGHHACGLGAGNLGRGQVVGQVQRHQRLKSHARWYGGQDALLVGQGLLGGGHRRLEVGHDDGATELGGGVGHHHTQGGTIAHMQVPVIGAGKGEFLGHGAYCLKPAVSLTLLVAEKGSRVKAPGRTDRRTRVGSAGWGSWENGL